MFSRLLGVAVILLMVATPVIAQTRPSSGGDSGRGGHSDGHYRSESQPTPSQSTGTTSSSSSSRLMSTGDSNYNNYSGGSSNYSGYNYYNYWDRTQNFYYALMRMYPFIQYDYYAYRLSLNDSPIDQSIVRLALRDSIETSNFLVSYTDELSGLLDQYEAGNMDKATFRSRFNRTVDTVRKLAKSIKGDYRLEYLDQRQGVELPDYDEAKSLAELRNLVAELRQQAELIETGLQNFYQKDMTRVIDVSTLKQPSFRTVSGRIEKLAKAIKSSSNEM